MVIITTAVLVKWFRHLLPVEYFVYSYNEVTAYLACFIIAELSDAGSVLGHVHPVWLTWLAGKVLKGIKSSFKFILQSKKIIWLFTPCSLSVLISVELRFMLRYPESFLANQLSLIVLDHKTIKFSSTTVISAPFTHLHVSNLYCVLCTFLKL